MKALKSGSIGRRTGVRITDPSEEGLFSDIEPAPMRRVLMAALEAFADRGYHGTTTRHIAQRAQVSPAGLYTHYRSKDELLYTIIRVTHEAILAEKRKVFAQSGTPVERLQRLVYAHAYFHATYHTAARVANYELHSLPRKQREEITELRRAMQQVMGEAIRLGMVSGDFDVDDQHLATTAVLSLGIDISRWFTVRGRLSADDVARRYADLVLRMMQPSDVATFLGESLGAEYRAHPQIAAPGGEEDGTTNS